MTSCFILSLNDNLNYVNEGSKVAYCDLRTQFEAAICDFMFELITIRDQFK